jgi:MFS family permease
LSAPPFEASTSSAVPRTRTAAGFLFDRQLAGFPDTRRRYWYLAIAVLTTVVLYYQLYAQYSVSTAIMTHYGMTFTFFVTGSVIGNAVGAFGALIAGLADRWGRANLTVYGTLLVGILVTFVAPQASDKVSYIAVMTVVSLVEGVILVATPALVRDFSPQLGRAAAMGFWTMGPVVGSLVVTLVVSHTYSGTTTWQDEVRYAGISGLIVFVAALFGLRELSPRLRDQIMVSLRDRALVEARAKGLDTAALTRGQWRQMLRPDILGSAFAISVFLLIYYAAVGSFTVYFSTTFGYPLQRTAGLLNWYWAADVIGLVFIGTISDRLRVRKPFMLIGAVGSLCFLAVFAVLATHPSTGYYTFVVLAVGLGAFGGIAFGPWMASFTETVERRNPAATATGLAVYGWLNRVIVAVAVAVLPVVVSSVTPLVEHGAAVKAAATQAAPALEIVDAHPQLFAQLNQYPAFADAPPSLQAEAVQQVGVPGLTTVGAAKAPLAVLKQYGASVEQASHDNPGNWQVWWWICFAGQLLFVPFIFGMAGRWSPHRARADLEAHEAAVAEQLQSLTAES